MDEYLTYGPYANVNKGIYYLAYNGKYAYSMVKKKKRTLIVSQEPVFNVRKLKR